MNENNKKIQTEYLFLDMEWNQAPKTSGLEGREPVQIGVVATDDKMQKVKSFSKAIRLENLELLSEKTIQISHVALNNLKEARTESIVLNNFAQTFPEYQYIVVWNRDTYELFKRDMKKHKVPMLRHRVVILQDVLSEIVGDRNRLIGFETALKCAGVEYVSTYLHYSKHDANYLYQLFYISWQQFLRASADEMCVANIKTKKLHINNCRYARNLPMDKMIETPKSDIFKGYQVCKCCGTSEEWKRLAWSWISSGERKLEKNKIKELKQLPLTEENIDTICRYFQVSYSVSNATVFVCTAFSR